MEASVAVQVAYVVAGAGPGALSRSSALREELRHLLDDEVPRLVELLGRSRQRRTRRAAAVVWPELVPRVDRPDVASTTSGLALRLRNAVEATREPPVTTCRFDGMELLAGRATFWPRRRSEALVAAATAVLGAEEGKGRKVIDVGTGCGAVGLAIARRVGDVTVLAADSEEAPLVWVRRNIVVTGLADRVVPCRSDLLSHVPVEWSSGVDLVVGNIPCVPATEFDGAGDTGAVGYVGAGSDGLGLHRRLLDQASGVLVPGGALVLQSRSAEVGSLVDMAASSGWSVAGTGVDGSVSVVTLVLGGERTPALAPDPED